MVFRAATILACTFVFSGIFFGATAATGKDAVTARPERNAEGTKPGSSEKVVSRTLQKPATGTGETAVDRKEFAPQTLNEIRKKAQFHTQRREFAEAVPLWTKLAQKKDAQAEAYLGWSQLQLGDKTGALTHINRAIALNPRTIEGYRYLGYYLISEGKVPEAVKAFRTSMSFDPHHKCNCGELEKLILSKSKHKKP